MTFEVKMTKDEIIEGLRATYGKEFTAPDVSSSMGEFFKKQNEVK